MIASKLQGFRRVVEWLAASLVATVGLRFAFVASVQVVNRPPERLLTPVPSSRSPAMDWSKLLNLPDMSSVSGEASAKPPKPTESPPIRVSLIVTAGAPRSEVYVNGVLVGNSPFVGDVACRRGDTVKIDVLPTRGAPEQFTRSCLDGTLRVGE